MNVQEIVVCVLVAGAVLFLLFKFLKPKKKEQCETDCNCK